MFRHAGHVVKLYGIVGLAFIFFSPGMSVLSLLLWAAVMFAAPMLISSPDYIVSQYAGWWESLSAKNVENMFSGYQNISLLGMVRKISAAPPIPTSGSGPRPVLLFGLPICAASNTGMPLSAMRCWLRCCCSCALQHGQRVEYLYHRLCRSGLPVLVGSLEAGRSGTWR